MQKNPVTQIKNRGSVSAGTLINELPEILNESVYLRGFQIADYKKKGVTPLLPISRSTWLAGVASNRFPSPIRIGRSTFWKSSDIRKLVIELGQTA